METGVKCDKTWQKQGQKTDRSSMCKNDNRDTGTTLPSRQTIVQPKLELTTPGDSYEREADRMADFVMRRQYTGIPTEMPSAASVVHPTISRSVSGSVGVAVDTATEGGINASQGGGQPMPEALRSRMESGFGADFSRVRLHTDSRAVDLSRGIQAKAFTYGNDIYFNRGQYSPDTTAGQHLIAHELTHVMQQSGKVGREEKSFSYCSYLFDKEGYYLGRISSLKKNHNAVYIALDTKCDENGDNIINTQLSIDKFLIMAATIQHEGSYKDDNEEELLWIAHTANNAANKEKDYPLFSLLSSKFSSVSSEKKNEYINMKNKNFENLEGLMIRPEKESSSKNSKFQRSRKALINVLMKEKDPTSGATRWDGLDFAYKICQGKAHPKLRQNKTIIINGDIFNIYTKKCGFSNKIPAEIRHKISNNVIYIIGSYNKGSITATGTKGQTIFWKKNRSDNKDYWKASTTNHLYSEKTIAKKGLINSISSKLEFLKSLIDRICSGQMQVDFLQSLILKHALKRGACDNKSVVNNEIAYSYRKFEETDIKAKTYTPFPGLVGAKKSRDRNGEYELTDNAIMKGTKCNFFVGDVLFAAYRDYIKIKTGENASDDKINELTISFFKQKSNLLQSKLKYPKYKGAQKMGKALNKKLKIEEVKGGDIIWWRSGEHIEIVVGEYDEKTKTLKCMGAHADGAYEKNRKITVKFMSEEDPKGEVDFYRMEMLPEISEMDDSLKNEIINIH